MSDLPALQLFEEIQGLSNSMDFFSYTKEDLNKTWSLYDDDSNMESKEQNTEKSPTTTTFSGKSSPTRDTWDPMLYNINLTTYVELSMEDDVQVRSKPMLETPITPLPGMEDLQMFLTVTQTNDHQARVRQMSTSRDQVDQARHFLQHNDHHQHCSGAFLAENRSGSLPQKVK